MKALDNEMKEAVSDDDRAMWHRVAEVSSGLQVNLYQLAHYGTSGAAIAGLEEEIRRQREQVKEEQDAKMEFYLRTKDGDAAFRRKNACTVYSDNAGIRWWFKYRDEPTFELPQRIIAKYHNGAISIRDVMNYWAEHRE